MTRDDIIRMAEQSDAQVFDKNIFNEEVWTFNFEELKRFAALVIANNPPQSYMSWQEREACAKVCEELERANLYGVKECAAVIRAKRKK